MRRTPQKLAKINQKKCRSGKEGGSEPGNRSSSLIVANLNCLGTGLSELFWPGIAMRNGLSLGPLDDLRAVAGSLVIGIQRLAAVPGD